MELYVPTKSWDCVVCGVADESRRHQTLWRCDRRSVSLCIYPCYQRYHTMLAYKFDCRAEILHEHKTILLRDRNKLERINKASVTIKSMPDEVSMMTRKAKICDDHNDVSFIFRDWGSKTKGGK